MNKPTTNEEDFLQALVADVVVVDNFSRLHDAINKGLVAEVKPINDRRYETWVFHTNISIYFQDYKFFVKPDRTFSIIKRAANEWEFYMGIPKYERR